MEYLEYLNEDHYLLQRPARQIFVDRSNPLNQFDEIHFSGRYCLYKKDALEITTLLCSMSLRGRSVPGSLRVRITLRFLASGTFHHETGDLCGVSEATVGRVVHNVCSAICELRNLYIKFPVAAEQANYKVRFHENEKSLE